MMCLLIVLLLVICVLLWTVASMLFPALAIAGIVYVIYRIVKAITNKDDETKKN